MQLLETFCPQEGQPLMILPLPDVRRFLTGSEDGGVRLHDLEDGRVLATLARHAGPVDELALDEGTRRVASAGEDAVVRLSPLEEGVEARELEGERRVAFAPGGHHFATLGADGSLSIFDADTGARRQRLPAFDRRPQVLAFAPHAGTLFVGGAGTIHGVALPDGTFEARLEAHEIQVTDLAISPTQALFGSVGADGRLVFWTVVGGSQVTEIDLEDRGTPRLVFRPDGRSVLVATASGLTLRSVPDGSARGAARLELPGIRALALVPGGETVLAALDSGELARVGLPG